MRKSTRNSAKGSRFSPHFIKRLSSWLVLSTVLSVSLPEEAHAATQTWNPASNTDVLWDSGTWMNWNAASLWTDFNDALFDGTATAGVRRAVLVDNASASPAVGSLTFDAAGYSIGTNPLAPTSYLTMGGGTVTTNFDATMSVRLNGFSSYAKAGTAKLTLSGVNNAYSGDWTINAGTLSANVTGTSVTSVGTGVTTASNDNALGTGAVTLAGGTLQLNTLSTVNQNGLSGRLFGVSTGDTTAVDYSGTANSTRYDANLNRFDLTTASGGGTALSPTTAVDVQWLGKLQITNAGSYRFFSASDDGSRIFIDGVLVLNNDGGKGTTDLGSAAITLSAGLHDIVVQYVQGGGGASEILSWSGGVGLDVGATETAIPSAKLWTAESNTTAAGSNAVVVGSGNGDALSVTATSTVDLNGTMFTQAQLGSYTQTVGTTLNVTGLTGKTLRLAGTVNLGNSAAGTVTINNNANVAFNGILTDNGFAVTLAKQGAGRLIFDQTVSANTFGSTSLVDVQGGTVVLVGGANNPIGTAGVQLSGGNVVLDSKSGSRTFDNVFTVTQDGTIQNIVGNQTITLGSGANGISIAATRTLTLDAITGGNNTNNNPTATAYPGATITIAGALTGAGNLTAISTSFGNNTTPGLITLTNAGNTLSGNITLNGTTITTNTVLPVNGPTLRPTVAGALPNTATTALFIRSGVLDLATNNIAYTPNAANVVTLGGGPTYTTSSINIGTGNLLLTNDVVYDATNNGGVATLRGNGAATGILDLNTAGQRTFNVGDSTNAPFDMIINAVLNGTGGGGLTKTGNGTLAIQANLANQNNGFTGLTQVSGGTLYVGGGALAFAGDAAIKGNVTIDASAIYRAGAGNIVVNTSVFTVNGTLDMNGFSEVIGTLAGNGVITSSVSGGNVALDFNIAPTFTGSITGQTGVQVTGRLATGNITIPTAAFSALTYNGNTIIGDAASTFINTLQISTDNALPFGFNKGDLTLIGTGTAARGGTLDLNGRNLTINALIGTAATGNPIVTNNGATDSILTIGSGNGGNTFGGIIQDGTTNKTGLVKTGLGTQVLSSANSFTGTVTINNGQLSITNAGALGTTAGATTVNAGGYLNIGNVSTAEPLTLNGRGQPFVQVTPGVGGQLFTGALQGSGGIAAAVTGPVTLGSNTSIGVQKGSMLTISGIISDGGSAYSLTKTQGDGTAISTGGPAGTLKLTGINTYTGATTIQGGELRLGTAGQAIASTVVNIGDGTNDATLTLDGSNQMPGGVILNFLNASRNAKFNLNGFTQTIAGFTNSGNLAIIQNFEGTPAPAAGTLIVNNPSDTTFSGLIRDQVATLIVTKQGAGTLTFSGNGAFGTAGAVYTGATSVTAGKLLLNDETAFNSPITLSSTGSLEFNYNFGRTLTYTKVLTDGGLGFTKTGLGTLALGTGSNNVVTGTVNVNAGVLTVQGATGTSTILAGAKINVAAGAQLNLFGTGGATSYAFDNLTTGITLNGLTPGGALAGAISGGTIDNTLTTLLNLNGAGMNNISTGWSDKTFRITGKITGAGGLQFDKGFYTQQPPVFQINNAANDYSGGTTINAGTVYFTAGLPATGNLNFGGYFTQSALTGAGNVINILTGPNIVLGTNGLAGFTRAVGTGAGQVSFTGEGGGFSAVGSAQTVNFGGASGSVDWGAAGFNAGATFFFNDSNTLAGGSGFNADNTVTVTNAFVLSTGGMRRIYVADNNGVTTDQVNFSGAISGPGGLIKDGGNSAAFTTNTGPANIQGRLILSGASANTYTGLTNVIAGTLALNKTASVNAIGGDLQIGGLQITGNNGTRRIVYLGANEQIPDSATVSLIGSNTNNGDLRLFGFSETVGAIQDRSGGGVIEISETGDTGFLGVAINTTLSSTLTVGGTIGSPVNTDSFYNGFLRTQSGGTGVLNLVKNGSGTLTISQGQQSGVGNATYNGTTTINGGKVVFANIGTYNSAITVNTGANVGFLTNINQSPSEGQIISGVGGLIKTGIGAMQLNGINTYGGITQAAAGNLIIQTQTNTTGNYQIDPGATLTVGNNTTTGRIPDTNNVTNNGTLQINRSNNYTYAGIVSGAGGVTKANNTAADAVLSGVNTYSGTTLVNGNTLTLNGNAVSGGGVTINSGGAVAGTLVVDFAQPGAPTNHILATTTPVTLNGGTLRISSATGTANQQNLGTITIGSGISVVGNTTASTVSTITAAEVGAGGTINLNLGSFVHNAGGVLNVAFPVAQVGSFTTTSPAVGGILGGYATTSSGLTWVAVGGGGILSPLGIYTNDTWDGSNIDATITSTQSAGVTANSLRFNSATTPYSVNLSGANTITTGGILVTSTVGGTGVSITGGTIQAGAGNDLTVIQGNTLGGFLAINSQIIDGGGATTLTKAGIGTLYLTGANTYTGGTVIHTGTLINRGSLGSGAVTVDQGAVLQIGDPTANGVIPTLNPVLGVTGAAIGIVVVANPTAQSMGTTFNAASNFNFLTNALNNGTSYQTGVFTKTGLGTLTITNAVVSNQFHQRGGLTVLDTGANVVTNNFNSVGQLSGDNAALTMKGNARFTESNDFNVGDVSGANGVFNIQDAAVLNIANAYIGKTGTATGVVNQSGFSTVNITAGGDTFRIGGAFLAGDVNAYGSYKLTSGTLTRSNGTFQPGAYGYGVFTMEGGAATFASWVSPARWQNSANGLINVQGGTFSATNAATRLIVGETGTGVLNVGVTSSAATPYSAGQLFLTGGLSSGGSTSGIGSGNSNLWYGGLINGTTFGDHDGNNATTTSTFNLHGGIVQARANSVISSAGGNLPLFGGGSATNNNGAFTNAYVYAEGANFDTNSFTATVAQPLVAPTGSGITTIPVATGGSGYQAEPIVSVTGGGGTGATARAIISGGVVTGFQITNPGVGYTSAPTVALVGGVPTVAATVTAGTATFAANATAGGLTKLGTGTMNFTSNTGSLGTTIGTASTYGGATTVNGGTLVLDFSGWNQTPTNMVPATSTLVLGGGALTVNGHPTVGTAPTGLTGTWLISQNIITLSAANANVVVGQTVTGTNIPAGAIVTAVNGAGITISAAPAVAGAAVALTFGTFTGAAASQTFAGVTLNAGANAVNAVLNSGAGTSITLGAITRNAGSSVDFALPATGTINTSTANTGATILGGWATVNSGANWAVGGGNIAALVAYTNDAWAAGNNTTVTLAANALATTLTTNSLRYNTAVADTVTVTGTNTITTGGILVTPTVAAFASVLTGGTIVTGGTNTDLVVNQFNTNAAGTLTIGSIIGINGTGGLVKSGGGVLILGGVNTYSGNTVIGAGTLRLSVANNTNIPNGAGKGDVVISAGATLDLNGFDETINGLSGYGTVTSGINSNKTLTVGDNNVSSTFSGVFLNGTSTANVLTKIGSGILTLNNVSAGTFTGNTNINAGAIKLATPNALANNTIVVVGATNGLLFDITTPTISALAGASNFALQTTATSALPNTAIQLSVGNNNNGNTFTGALTGSGALIKIGTGTQTLAGANTNAGGLYANAGYLVLSGNNSGAGGSVFVNSGGILQLNAANSLWAASGRNLVVASGGIVTGQAFTGNPAATGFGALTPLLARLDTGSTGVLGLQVDGSLQTAISESFDFSTSGQVSLGSILTVNSGFGNAPVQYTGVITPNANTFRLGGGGGRLILPNGATLAGANGLFLYGGGSTTGLVYLTAAYGFTGGTTVNAGTTYINTLADGGIASSLGAASAVASNLVLNGGTLIYIGNGSSTNRLFTISAAPTALEASGTGPVNFTSTGALGFLNSGNRTFTLQGQNTGANTIAAAIGDSVNVAGTSGVLASGTTAITKAGNGTWILSGTNTFSGGVTINNGVLGFTSAAAIGANSVNGPATVLVNSNGAVALAGALATGIQTTLNRISPLSTGTVALTANSSENINFDGGAGAGLPQATLGAYGNATYTGTLTPFGTQYRLGGGGGVLTMPNGGLTGPRIVQIGGGGPFNNAGAFQFNPTAGFYQNPNLNGAVVLGGTSDYTGGTVLNAGGIVSATSVTALGTGPLKFQGGFYRAVDTTDITLASDGTSARDIRIGFDSGTGGTANIDVVPGVSVTFSKTFGALATFGSNQGQATMTKYGAGALTLANGLNLTLSAGGATTNAGTLTIERGTLSIGANPTNFTGLIQVGSNNGGVGTLKLVADNVFKNTVAQFGSASVIDTYSGSKIDLNGFSDTIRFIRGMGTIVNTGAGSPTLTTGTVNSENMIFGGNLAGNFVLKRVGNIAQQYGTGGANNSGIELWNNYNPTFTGKFVADAGGIRFRADGTLGSTAEPLVADKITLDNGGILYTTGNPLVLGANRGITLGSGGGNLWAHNGASMIVNGPIAGSGLLTIADDNGSVYLGSDSNTYTGGTMVNGSNADRSKFVVGAGGATGALPATGDVFLNGSGGTTARIYFFTSSDKTVPNNINGGGIVLQIGGGTTTFTGNNTTNLPIWIGGGRYKADFSLGNAPVSTGVAVNINGGAFEYKAAAGDNTLRLGTLALGAFFGNPHNFNGGLIGDSAVQSTYGGSGTQTLMFGGNSRTGTGSTMNFVVSGGTNGTTNSIRFSSGTINSVIGASYFFNGADFAALDSTGYVRAAVYGSDANTSPLNTLISGRYGKLTTSLINQGPVSGMPGIVLSGAGVDLNFASSGNTAASFTLNGNPATILKTGGGTSIVSSGTIAQTINPQVSIANSLNNNGQELILRADTASDTLQIDMPIAGGGALTKSGDGTLILTAANTYTGSTFINSGSVTLTGSGVVGTATNGTSVRIANAAGSTATLNINSASASIVAGGGTGGDALRIGEAGSGTLNQTAGTVTGNQFVTLGENLGSAGTYNMSGGTLSVKNNNSNSPSLVVGRAGIGAFNLSGTAAVSVLNGGQVQLGSGNVNPGQFQNLVADTGISTGVGTITQTGGTLTVATNNAAYQSNAFGAVILGVDGAGTYTLNGGTLTTPILARGNGTATFNLGGGTLKAPTPVATLPSIFNLDLPVNLTGTGAGKGTIDTNANDVTFTGALSGAGGIAKASTGVLNVLGAGSYAGGTDINGGSIVASGTSLGTGTVTVGASGTLQVQGVQSGLLARFFPVIRTDVTPVNTASAGVMYSQLTSLDGFNAFLSGKAMIAAESTAARGKVSVDYLEIGGANQATALPPQIIALSNGSNTFVTHLGGNFNAATAGDYTFQTRSDDGSVLWVDGILAVDNNRSQGQNTRTGTINLTAGLHDIVIGYIQGAGGGGFSVGVTLPGKGQSFTIGSELNMSNDLLSYGSSALTIGSLAGVAGSAVTIGSGTLTVGDGLSTAFSGVISGAGGKLVKVGSGTLTLDGAAANTYSGLTTVSNGVLSLAKTSGSNSIPGNGIADKVADVLVNGGTLRWDANHQVGDLVFVNLTSGSVNVNGKTDTIYDLNVSGGTFTTGIGANFTVTDPTFSGGTSTISSASTANFGVLNISGGTNTVQGKAAQASAGVLNVGAGGVNFSGTASPALTLNSDATSAGKLVLSGNITSTVTAGTAAIASGGVAAVAGTVDLNGATRTISVADGTASTDLAIGAKVIGGAGSAINKTGLGALGLNGDQDYPVLTTTAGVTNINGSFTNGTSTVNANSTTNFGASQTLGALNIGAGTVVTFGSGPFAFTGGGGSKAAASSVVPEPGSISLLLVGALGILNRRRREKNL